MKSIIEMLKGKTIIAFGVGQNFYSYIERLDRVLTISYFSDNDCNLWGKRLFGDERKCMDPIEIKELGNPFVIITVDKVENILEISQQFSKQSISICHALDILEVMEEKLFECRWPQLIQRDRIHRFLDVDLSGTTVCNFRCKYCYVWRKDGFKGNIKTSDHTPKEIRTALSQQHLGGQCFINICARGETLLSENIVELVYELLSEGHFVAVVTNGTITKRILKLLEFPEELLKRLFFKISFHYEELMEKEVCDQFWRNVDSIKESRCSYTLELTPYDGLISNIDDIKKMFREKADGALPHVSFARDAKKKELDVLSDLSIEEYNRIWDQFDSNMFRLKRGWYGKRINSFCYAGSWSSRIDLLSGNIQPCYRHDIIGNIFDKSRIGWPEQAIERDCRMSYCFNNHAFLAWGCVPEIVCESYLDMRDRVDVAMRHWVKEPMYSAIKEKLYNNNFQYAETWDDYKKLFKNRRPAILLFNSPDYPNLGDHAIAAAERLFFENYFPERDIIEISCRQYVKENVKIINAVLKEDIIIISGGGNIGSLWLYMEDLIRNIIIQFRDNKIFIFPQTIYYEDTHVGKIEREITKKVYSRHPDLFLALREEKSYEIAEQFWGETKKKIVVPDMALALRYNSKKERKGIYVCFRNDKEGKLIGVNEIIKLLEKLKYNFQYISMNSIERVYLNNRKEKLREIFDMVSGAQLVITDRLHCMIFCAITCTPCIAFDNKSGKVFGVYEKWLHNTTTYIETCTSVHELREKITKVLGRKEGRDILFERMDYEFKRFAEFIRKEGKIGDHI